MEATKGEKVAAKERLPREVIRLDKELVGCIDKGSDDLGKLRYEWCVTRGWSYNAYAIAAGTDANTVGRTVRRYADLHGLSVEVESGVYANGRKANVDRATGRAKRSTEPKRYLQIAYSPADYAALVKAAKSAGMPLATYVRQASLSAARLPLASVPVAAPSGGRLFRRRRAA